ncbi:Radical SAM protein [Candidatus Desulfarcum epimagneticum]|uniref:Radical SAM protein n=1 Tax=uncultured Desulfobacteraceae bacterium TaxID=218296 RepID=A0A484HJ60_9BACT|nr:Radical SAM protein [uncultured Desulfobacteraceae bacterium]
MKKRARPAAALVADGAGEIFELEGYAAVGMAGESWAVLTSDNAIPMPRGGELMFLPDRLPVLYHLEKGIFQTLNEDPRRPGEKIFPVAAFNSPGYVARLACAFEEAPGACELPLFSYAAAGWRNGGFHTAALCVDREKRQDLRFMAREKVVAGIREMRRKMPKNRLRKHLESCALEHGCPAGKNFFLKRFEAPLPLSRTCDARCLGCISLQGPGRIKCGQERISFTPSPEDIAEVALSHIQNVRRAVVSFGQGCEGEPLMDADVIERAIRLIRSQTRRGTIHLNTNASRPQEAARLFDAGLDSMRASMNSVRPACYHAYFRPVDYTFSDVEDTIALALAQKKFVSINYLNCPGFTDTPGEINALASFIRRLPVHMIQWRNLNFDPGRYPALMRRALGSENPVDERPAGMKHALAHIKKQFPKIKYGYFNPPKEKFGA